MLTRDNKKNAELFTRRVRDGEIAAAIGVALALGELEQFPGLDSASVLDSPWIIAGRTGMVNRRKNWNREDRWGNLTGWCPNPVPWRNSLR